MAAQKSTGLRRHLRKERLYEVQIGQAALHRRQDEFVRHALAAPAPAWPEAAATRPEIAAKVRYVIQFLAVTREAQGPRRRELTAREPTARVFAELARLSDPPGSTTTAADFR